MIKHDSNLNARLGILAALLAAIAVLAIPAAASAQDPAGDQYAPATPNGGGDYDFGPTGTPAPTSGTDSGSGAPGTNPTTAPTAPTDPAATIPTGSTGEVRGNRDQRTISQLGAEGEQARVEAPGTSTGADARLASSDASTSGGLGTLLWVLVGAALLWAIVIGVVNFRRRGEEPGRSSRGASGQHGGDDDARQPA